MNRVSIVLAAVSAVTFGGALTYLGACSSEHKSPGQQAQAPASNLNGRSYMDPSTTGGWAPPPAPASVPGGVYTVNPSQPEAADYTNAPEFALHSNLSVAGGGQSPFRDNSVDLTEDVLHEKNTDGLGAADYRVQEKQRSLRIRKPAELGIDGSSGFKVELEEQKKRELGESKPMLGDIPVGGDLFKKLDGKDAGRTRESELLIIERRHESEFAQRNALGCGGMVATYGDHQVPVPLKHTDVQASIAGYISTVNVTQQFNNPYDSKIEAVYVFPLPDNAAVSDFLMTIGDRTIRGIIREREQAEQIYAAARAQGYVASLMTEERPNIFTQKVANIEPGKAIDINIKYYSTLTYSDGGYEFHFPMVIGPRFNPPGTTDGVGAVAKGAQGASGQQTEVQYLRPEQRSGHDISLAVDIDAGVSIERVSCVSHAIDVQRPDPTHAKVRLSKADNIPNRDFVLRYDVASDYVKSALFTHEDSRGGFFSMMLVPPKDLEKVQRGPVEMVFVLDCSGSMSGRPIEQAKLAIERGLKRLQPGDSFQIIDFAETATALGAAPLEATPANIQRGLKFLAPLDANGGTYMINGLRASLDFPHDPERLRFVAFCTDGYIGNESEILGELHKKLGPSRIFSFGVGSSNRYLLDSMARMGNGVASFLDLKDDAGAIMDSFFDRVSHPALCDLAIDWGGAHVTDVYPSRTPDLFVGRPVIITGRYTGQLPPTVRVTGRVGREHKEIDITAAPLSDAHAALPQVWARTKLAALGDQGTWDAPAAADIAGSTRQVSLDYNILSPFTAFIAVDSMTKTAGTFGTTVQVPVPVPEGVKYDTTVGAR